MRSSRSIQVSVGYRLLSVEVRHYERGVVLVSCFLLSSDIRSEGSIEIVKKLDFDFFLRFFIPHQSHTLESVLEKNVCLSLSLSLSLSV